MQKLFRSRNQKVFAGVCGGLSEYFKVDAVFIRILFVVAFFSGGLGLIAYLIFWIATPQEPFKFAPTTSESIYNEGYSSTLKEEVQEIPHKNKVFLGYLLITIGVVILLGKLIPFFDFTYVLALIFVGMGLFLLFSNMNRAEQ